jgi:hypothetical protein
MESHNAKIKQVVSSSSSLHEMFHNLLSLSSLMYQESVQTSVASCVKTTYSTKDASREAFVISNSCTKYASSILLNELHLVDECELFQSEAGDTGNVRCKNNNKTYLVECSSPNVYKCTCTLYKSHCLPCRHIFLYLQSLDIVLCNVILSLGPQRFLNEYNLPNSHINADAPVKVQVPLKVSTTSTVSMPTTKFER